MHHMDFMLGGVYIVVTRHLQVFWKKKRINLSRYYRFEAIHIRGRGHIRCINVCLSNLQLPSSEATHRRTERIILIPRRVGVM